MPTYSSEKEEILEVLRGSDCQSLWHFTCIDNLGYIRDLSDLRSKEYLEKYGYFQNISPGGNQLSHDLDRSLGNWDKISLNFTPHNPMAYWEKGKKCIVFIEIDIKVATYEGVFFTDCNATRCRNGQFRDKGIAGLSHVKFKILNGRPKPWKPDWVKYVQAEALVPDFIPLERFKAIHFISEACKLYGQYMWGEESQLFKVRRNTFLDSGAIQFPYLESLSISTKEATKENIDTLDWADSYLHKGEPFWLLLRLYANSGTKASVYVSTSQSEETIFDSAGNWKWWPSFIAPNSSENVQIEVHINDEVWIKHQFEVRDETIFSF
jgi:hypothetical protein